MLLVALTAVMMSTAPPVVADTVILGEGLLQPEGSSRTAFRNEFCAAQPCLTISNAPVSTASQANLFDAKVRATEGPVSVHGYSLSAAAVYELVAEWEADPENAPDPEEVRLVTYGNPSNKYGGSNVGEATTVPLPANQPYDHLTVTIQYDSVADTPTRFGWFSAINTAMSRAHVNYHSVDINAPTNLVYESEDDNTTYMLVPANTLPMVAWLDPFLPDAAMEQLDNTLRPLVEQDYSRPAYVEQGEGADWVNEAGLPIEEVPEELEPEVQDMDPEVPKVPDELEPEVQDMDPGAEELEPGVEDMDPGVVA